MKSMRNHGISSKVSRVLGAMAISILMLVILFPATAHAGWPTDADWNFFYASDGVTPLWDKVGDSQNSRDLVGDSSTPTAYSYNDGEYLYYRMRLDEDPSQSGYLQQFGWGLIIDTDGNLDDYEWLIMVDGVADEISLQQNTEQGTIGDPSDDAEVMIEPTWPEALDNTPGSENFRVIDTATTSSPSTFDGDPDYFLDFRIDYEAFVNATGIQANDEVSFFFGTSNSAQSLSTDLVAGNLNNNSVDIVDGISDEVTPEGTRPSTGTVKFVSDATGIGADVTDIFPGDVVYVQVDDADQNITNSVVDTITVVVISASGDSETVTLTETDVASGIFTGLIASDYGAATTEDANLDLLPTETVTVTYVDEINALFETNQDLTDTLTANPSADISVLKTVSNSTPNTNDVITYTLIATNNGPGSADGIEYTDNLPAWSAKLEYVLDDSSGDPNQTYSSGTGIWSIITLGPGESATLNIDVKVLNAVIGDTVVNTATKTAPLPATLYDPDTSNDDDSASITIAGSDLVVTKTVDDPTAAVSSSVTYTITVTNAGSNTAANVEVEDTLPLMTELTYVSDDGGAQTAFDGSRTVTWTIGDMGNGDVATLNIDGTVIGGTLITNTAVATTSGFDPDAGNDTDTADIYVSGVDLDVAKSVVSATPNEGDTITYTVTLDNLSVNDATGVTITDDILTLAGEVDLTLGSSSASIGTFDEGTGIWSIATLAGLASATLTYDAVVQAGTTEETITNTVVADANEGEPDEDNNTDSSSLTVKGADLSLAKGVSNVAPAEGETITYTITVTNTGPDTATGVEVTEDLPSLSTELVCAINTVPAGTSYVLGTGVWTVGSMSVDESLSLLLDCTVQAGTFGATITNNASVTASDVGDIDSSNDSASEDITVGGLDIEVLKTIDNVAPSNGDPVVYTITVINYGPSDATDIEISDALPGGVDYDSDSATQGSYAGSPHFKWTVGDITYTGDPAVDRATLTLNATVTGVSGDIVTNTARLTSVTESDIDSSNDVANVTFVVGSTDVSVDKEVGVTSATVGDDVTYTITVTNSGGNTATGLEVTDNLPSLSTKVVYVAASAVPSQGAYDDATGVWTIGTVDPGATVTLTLDATVQTGTCGTTITNSAEKSTMNEGDYDDTNDSDTAAFVVSCANLSITKIANKPAPKEGVETVTYTITVTNFGQDTATNITVVDTLPDPATEFVDYLANDGGAIHDGDRTLTWSVGTLAKSASATLEVYVLPQVGSAGSTITNTATVSSADVYDNILANNTSSYDISPISWPNLSIVKTVSTAWDPYNLDGADATKPKAIPGAYVDYTIQVDNTGTGSADAGSVVLVDPIPSGTELYVGDLGGGSPVVLTDLTPNSELDIASIEYDDGGGYGYDPVPDADIDGFNSNVSEIRVTIGGTLDGDESFTITFRVRVQ